MKNGDQPAYPSEFEGTEKDEFGMPLIVHRKCYGLTKREYFAAMAMQGLLANPFYAEIQNNQGNKSPVDYSIDKTLAIRSVEIADSILKQLETK